jgi:hypothetical protein
MDAHYTSTKASYCRPKHYRERALLEMEAAVGARMAPLLVAAQEHGKPNSRVREAAGWKRGKERPWGRGCMALGKHTAHLMAATGIRVDCSHVWC